jgi:hypothetical protein
VKGPGLQDAGRAPFTPPTPLLSPHLLFTSFPSHFLFTPLFAPAGCRAGGPACAKRGDQGATRRCAERRCEERRGEWCRGWGLRGGWREGGHLGEDAARHHPLDNVVQQRAQPAHTLVLQGVDRWREQRVWTDGVNRRCEQKARREGVKRGVKRRRAWRGCEGPRPAGCRAGALHTTHTPSLATPSLHILPFALSLHTSLRTCRMPGGRPCLCEEG